VGFSGPSYSRADDSFRHSEGLELSTLLRSSNDLLALEVVEGGEQNPMASAAGTPAVEVCTPALDLTREYAAVGAEDRFATAYPDAFERCCAPRANEDLELAGDVNARWHRYIGVFSEGN
jgi:hypothetical protein